jgi:hypothetical protein
LIAPLAMIFVRVDRIRPFNAMNLDEEVIRALPYD